MSLCIVSTLWRFVKSLYWTEYKTNQAAGRQGRTEFIYYNMCDWSLTGNIGKRSSIQLRHICQ